MNNEFNWLLMFEKSSALSFIPILPFTVKPKVSIATRRLLAFIHHYTAFSEHYYTTRTMA